jgi:hypothetical protein
MIGCGLGGGDWDAYSKLIADFAKQVGRRAVLRSFTLASTSDEFDECFCFFHSSLPIALQVAHARVVIYRMEDADEPPLRKRKAQTTDQDIAMASGSMPNL